MDQALFLNGLIYIAAAALATPLGRRLGLGAVLGYLIIAALIGPSALELLPGDREKVVHFAEFGVVLMLFVVGLELDLSKLWRMRGPIFGLGGLQVLLTTLAVALTALAFQTACGAKRSHWD
jgi:Kef-type K+ transport system membrane component KefB